MPGRDSNSEHMEFISAFGLEGIPMIPDNDDHDLWLSFGVCGQPAWALIRADGSTEIGFGGIPDSVFAEAAGA